MWQNEARKESADTPNERRRARAGRAVSDTRPRVVRQSRNRARRLAPRAYKTYVSMRGLSNTSFRPICRRSCVPARGRSLSRCETLFNFTLSAWYVGVGVRGINKRAADAKRRPFLAFVSNYCGSEGTMAGQGRSEPSVPGWFPGFALAHLELSTGTSTR